MKIIISKDAGQYMRRERLYISQFEPRAAEAIMRQLQASIKMLAAYPKAGAASPLPGRRRFVSGNYVIEYTYGDDRLMISAIRNGRQNDQAMDRDDNLDLEE